MEYIVSSLRRRFFSGEFETIYFKDELARLKKLFNSLALGGESGSLLIVGRRGIGKRRLLTQAIHQVRKDSSVRSNLLLIQLNGLVHTDDRLALRAMAQQVHRQSSLLEARADQAEDQLVLLQPTDEQRLVSLTFSQQLRCFLDGLRADESLEKGCTRSLLIVLYEFDLFALHHNQILLYNLFDCCQNSHIPICVVGVTCRLDIMELLEKRVKSRFSHRQIHLLSVAAPTSGMATSDSPLGAFNQYCEACRHLLSLPTTTQRLEDYSPSFATSSTDRRRHNVEVAVTTWNRHVAELMKDDIVVDTLRQAWSISVGLDYLLALLIPIVAKLCPDKERIDPVEFIDSLCALRQDAKVTSLKGLSVLELFIVTTLVKLQDGRDGQLANFELVYSEYAKFCRTNCPGYLYEKAVVNKALDNLIDLELVATGRTAVAAAAGQSMVAGGAGSRPGGQSQLPNYRPLFCFVGQPVLSACLEGYSNCPIELSYWVHSKTF